MSASWRLRVERGPNAGQSFPIDQSAATIGRQENNTIVLDDARLSRQHARIDNGPGGLSVADLNSANGTQVNGRSVSGSVALQAGDRVQLGDTIMVIEGGPAPLGGDVDATLVAGAPPGGGTPGTTPAYDVPRLVLQGTGEVFRLDRPAMVIGRQPDNELPLDDTQSSRQHARFDISAGQVTLVDLGSANGTRVNGSRITAPTPLKNGDVVQVGTSQLRVEGIPFVDRGTAAALGFFPPLSTGPALDAAPPLDAPPALGGPVPFGAPPVAGATAPGSAPPNFGGPPLGPPGAPGQHWNSPPGPQFGGAPPIQPPLPPAAPARRKRSPVPLILIALLTVLLLLCVGGGTAAFLVSRGNSDPTATPNTSSAGTAVPAAASTTTPQPATGRSGGNTAPPPPGASAAPSSAPAVPTAGAVPPAAAPSAAAAQPTRSAAPSARPSARPSAPAASGNRRVLSVESIGLSFSIPADWTQTANEAGRAGFRSPDGQAQIVVRWSAQVPGGLTAQQMIRQELLDTAKLDPALDVNAVPTGTVQIGGQQGYGSEPYTFRQQGTTRITEADRAVVLPGEAQYFFGFLALESAFDSYAATFDEIIETIKITGP